MSTLNTRTIKEMANHNQKIAFQFYRDGKLWYATECGFEFPVPILRFPFSLHKERSRG
jgi:hypothetical protein